MNKLEFTPDEDTRRLAAALAPAQMPPANILIVDDEPRNLTVLETVLADPNYRLVRAVSPDEALLAVVSQDFALLILDVQMPGMTGFELAHTIKSRRKSAQIPIIFLTAHFNDDEHVLEGYGTGAVDYLHKPVNAAALRSKVAVFTELHRRGQELALANRALAAEVVNRTRAQDELTRWNAQLDQVIAERTSALNASNARLRLATDAVGLGFWEWELDTDHWLWENESPQFLFQTPRAHWPTSSEGFTEVLHPDDVPRFADAVSSVRRTGSRFFFQGRMAGDAGLERSIELDGRLLDEPGRPRKVLGSIRDVSEQLAAAREVRASEARYRSLFHSIDDGFCMVDMLYDAQGEPTDFRFVETNAGFERHTGVPGAPGRLASMVMPGLEEVWLKGLADVAATGSTFRHQGWMAAIGRIVEVHAFSVDGVVGTSVAMLIRDITARRRAEDSLRERERFLTTVTEAASVGIAVIDADFRYRFVNDAFAKLLNTPEKIVIGEPVGVINPERWAFAKPAIERALAGESLSLEFSVESTASSGELSRTRHLCAFLEPHTDQNDSPTAAVVLVDITNVKQLEAELQAADRHKDEFLATLAHELRNPLAPVRNAVRILHLKSSADPQAIRAADIIERQVKVMARLIDDLMDVARISQGRLELRFHDVDLRRAIDLAIEGSRPLIEEAAHAFEVDLPECSILVRADVTRLAQVFSNILTNASKYTNRGGAISLSVVVEAETVRVVIRDNGIGIAPENLARVFDMFSQVEVALARSRGGLGIGLSLAKRLVELHGGTIEASSEGLGRGSAFTITLPRINEGIIVPATGLQPLSAREPLGLRVLVVDDNLDGAETLALLLEMHGCTTQTAADGEEAVATAEDMKPDVILLDIGLPKLNGYEVCKAIRARPWSAGTTIIAITGWGDPKAKAAATEAGFDHHFVKPVVEGQLMETIARLRATSAQ